VNDVHVASSECGDEYSLPSHINKLCVKAYGAPLVFSDRGNQSSLWYQRWSVVVHHKGSLYSLPGGSIAKRYINQLTDELIYLCDREYPSEHVLVYSAVMLQRDHSVVKG